MKKWMTKLVGIACACVCAFAFVGCNPTGGGGNGWTTTGTLEFDEQGKVVYNDVILNLTTVVSGTDESAFRALVRDFNIEYDGKITVNVDAKSNENFEAQVPTAIRNNNNAPDFIMSHQMGHKAFVENRIIQPFDEVLEKSHMTFNMNDYGDMLAQYAKLGTNNLYDIPCDVQGAVVLYNKQLLGSDSLPTNRSELLALCAKFKAANPTKYAISVPTNHGAFLDYLFPSAVLQNGGTFSKADYHSDWTSSTNMPAFKNAVQSVRELRTLGYMSKTSDLADAATLFMNDNALFYITVPWEVSSNIETFATGHGITTAVAQNERLGATSIAKWFAMGDNASQSYASHMLTDSHTFSISTTVTDITKKAAICEFIKWFTTKANVGIDWAKAGHLSMSKIIDNDATYQNNTFVKDYMKKFYPDINAIECYGANPHANRLQSTLHQLIVDALKNTTSGSDESIITAQNKAYNDYINDLAIL